MHPWLLAASGGVLVGLSAVLLMGSLGRIAGISGIAAGLVSGAPAGYRAWRACFVLGMLAAPVALSRWTEIRAGAPEVSWPWMLAAGLLVGLVICGRCGRRMTPSYGSDSRVYHCRREQITYDLPQCPGAGGSVRQLLVDVVNGADGPM